MNFYDFTQIKAAADCVAVARDLLGMQLSPEGRCAATWRGGDNPESVSINKDGWHDFGTEESGSVIDLVARVRCGGNVMEAQEILGVYLHLSPKMATKAGCIESGEKYDRLIAAGYHEVKRYSYTDASGALVNQVVRLEHPTQKKEFLQCTPRGWGLRDVIPPLYNLPMLRSSSWALLVEGEKDADNLIALNLPATTVCGGAKKWRDEYTQEFDDKDVAILPDNDDAGRAHARLIAHKLIARARAKSVRIVPTSSAPKGDVSDFFAEGHTWDEVAALIAAAPALTAAELADAVDDYNIEEAKAANSVPFRNFTPTVQEMPGGRKRTVKTPRQINKLIDDIHRRFLGFPRKVGEQLFDHDRDTGRIISIDKQSTLFAWIQRKSGQLVEWSKEEGCATKEELFEGLLASARRYEAISSVPDWPPRHDVYYSCGELPPPDPEHRRFFHMIDCFSPAGPEYRPILMALFAAPLFYIRGVPRPLWIIDAVDGAGSGKTTIVDAMALVYDGTPISTSEAEMKRSFVELVKRIVSSEGRRSRILLLDNITGSFSCPELADLATKVSISGRPAYGRGEEVRPNNLTCIITANSANVDNDLASRAFYMMVGKPNYSAGWRRDTFGYIAEHRMEILADLIDLLDNHKPFNLPPMTRCPEFETMVLQAFCRDSDEYSDVVKLIAQNKADTNIEDDMAKQIEEIIRFKLIELECAPRINPDRDRVFIRSEVVEIWFRRESVAEGRRIVQTIRNLANMGLMPHIHKRQRKYPNNGPAQRKGIMWCPPDFDEEGRILVVGRIGNGKIGVVFQ
nr:MAG TPA: DNA directed DNA polymerase [Caudoviricetes sp.]